MTISIVSFHILYLMLFKGVYFRLQDFHATTPQIAMVHYLKKKKKKKQLTLFGLLREVPAEFSRFAGMSSAAISQQNLLGFERAQLEFYHLH